MRYRVANMRHWMLGATVVLAISSTGCQSGWKMPGSSMFSWGKKPDAETIAGKSPSVYPTSPAQKYSPSTVSSVASNSAPAGSASMTGAPTTANNMLPSGGAAAAGNGYRPAGAPTNMTGYSTGPYSTGGAPTAGVLAGGAGATTASAMNPYGAASSAGMPSSGYPTGSPSNALPGAGATTANGLGSYAGAASPSGTVGPTGYMGSPANLAVANSAMQQNQPANVAPAAVNAPMGAASGYANNYSTPANVAGGYGGVAPSNAIPSLPNRSSAAGMSSLPGMPMSQPGGMVGGMPAASSMPSMNPSASYPMPQGMGTPAMGQPGSAAAMPMTGTSAGYRTSDTKTIPYSSGGASLPQNPAAQSPAGQYNTGAAVNPNMANYNPYAAAAAPGGTANAAYTTTSSAGQPGAVPAGFRPGSTGKSPYDFSNGSSAPSTGATMPPMPALGAPTAGGYNTQPSGPSSLPSYPTVTR